MRVPRLSPPLIQVLSLASPACNLFCASHMRNELLVANFGHFPRLFGPPPPCRVRTEGAVVSRCPISPLGMGKQRDAEKSGAIRRMTENYPMRLEAIIAAEGGPTRY